MMTRPISDLDVPTGRLEADLRALVARQREQRLARGIAAEARHLMDESVDFRFTQLACDHPDRCSRICDYPDWTPNAWKDNGS